MDGYTGTALFWPITQRVVVFSDRRFGQELPLKSAQYSRIARRKLEFTDGYTKFTLRILTLERLTQLYDALYNHNPLSYQGDIMHMYNTYCMNIGACLS